jgi:hypothetical protein
VKFPFRRVWPVLPIYCVLIAECTTVWKFLQENTVHLRSSSFMPSVNTIPTNLTKCQTAPGQKAGWQHSIQTVQKVEPAFETQVTRKVVRQGIILVWENDTAAEKDCLQSWSQAISNWFPTRAWSDHLTFPVTTWANCGGSSDIRRIMAAFILLCT